MSETKPKPHVKCPSSGCNRKARHKGEHTPERRKRAAEKAKTTTVTIAGWSVDDDRRARIRRIALLAPSSPDPMLFIFIVMVAAFTTVAIIEAVMS